MMKRQVELGVGSTGETTEPKRKKRIDSCQNCRLRKVRCDKDTPCKHCMRRGEASTCTYEDQSSSSSKREKGAGSDQSLVAELARVKARLERVEAGQKSVVTLQGLQRYSPASQVISNRPQSSSEPISLSSTITPQGNPVHNNNHHNEQKDSTNQGWEDWSMYRRLAQGEKFGHVSISSYHHGSLHNTSELPNYLLSILPARGEAIQLIEDNNRRLLKTLFGNCVHMPTFRKEVEVFYDDVVADREINKPSLDWFALFFAFMLLAITHPSRYPGQYPSQLFPDTTLLLHPSTTSIWHDAIIRCLEEDKMQLRSIHALQAIILLDFYESDTDLKLARLRLAITSAQRMGLHRLGQDRYEQFSLKSGSSSKKNRSREEREIQKRVWWALVVHDWNGATEVQGYIVQPDLFNTPVPCNYNDEDLHQSPLTPPRPLEELTQMSSMLCTIRLSSIIREHGELLHRSRCNEEDLTEDEMMILSGKYQDVWEKAPSAFRIISWEGKIDLKRTTIMVQSWMLQQGVFHKLLDLHSSSFSSRPYSFSLCFDLARSILSLQSRIRTTCSLVDQLWVNLAHSFSAAIILCIGLLDMHEKMTFLEREAIRELVGEALSTFDFINAFHANAAIRMQQVVDILLAEEQKQYQQLSFDSHSNQERSGKNNKLLTVVSQVVKVVYSDPKKEDAESLSARDDHYAPSRPFHGILRSDIAEPNGVKLGQSNSVLPELVLRALETLEEGDETKVSTRKMKSGTDASASSFDAVHSFTNAEVEAGASDQSNSITSPSFSLPEQDYTERPLIDMGSASDSFWAWLLNEDLLMLNDTKY